MLILGTIMDSRTPIKKLSIVLFSIPLLLACDSNGGLIDSDNVENIREYIEKLATDLNLDLALPEPILVEIITDTTAKPDTEQNTGTPITINGVAGNHNKQAAIIADNEINLARVSCGLNALSSDPELENIAIAHANYIQHVYANATPTVYDAHSQSKIDDIATVTGESNPFFTGASLGDRLSNTGYSNVAYGVAENIAQSIYFNSIGDLLTPDVATLSMTKSLLAAPYHLRALMIPSSILSGTGVAAYKPYGKGANNNQGYVLVNNAAATIATRNTSFEGIFTYPCQGVTDTVTALYNESPDPFRGARNLQANPIGQPIYVNVPSANTIKLSNVSLFDIERNSEVPVQLLDADQDPYKGTNYQLPANEAFILPLTDELESCEHRPKIGQNCGLYGNTQYRISFDILIDNNVSKRQSFTFKTGEVSY